MKRPVAYEDVPAIAGGGDLTTAIQEQAGAVMKTDDALFDTIVTSAQYFPRLQLMSSQSAVVQEGKIPGGHYALVKDKALTDVGGEVDVLVLAWRPKALQTIGDSVIVVFKPDHSEFVRISEESANQDSGCMFGPEFLVWVAEKESYATFFMASKTARREAPNLKALIGSPATLGHKVIKSKKFTWIGPTAKQCSAPLSFPSIDEIKEQIAQFAEEAEKEPELEAVTGGAGDISTRER